MKFQSNLYELYSSSISLHISQFKKNYPLDRDFVNEGFEIVGWLNQITKHMLLDRFMPKTKKEKKNKNISSDLLRFLDIKEDKNNAPLNPLHAVKFYKGLENLILSGNVPDLEDLNLGQFKSTALLIVRSLPKILLDTKLEEDRCKADFIQILFSSIIIYRQFKVKTLPDINTIISEYTGESIEEIICQHFVGRYIDDWSKEIVKGRWKAYPLTLYSGNASSPNSGASTTKLLDDVSAVSQNKGLEESIFQLASHFKGYAQFKYIYDIIKLNISPDPKFGEGKVHSRIVHFTAPGGKSRIIAIGDWISQSALSSIHFTLFHLLSKIPSDRTFDHEGGMDIYDGPDHKYYSIDLSAATDRMPRVLQSKLLTSIYQSVGLDGESIGNAWLRIVDREYSTKNSGLPIASIKYAVGQGMGLFTSWTLLALMHHYIVNKICDIPMSDYRIVGDDLIIRDNEDGYKTYIRFMNRIGMTVNESKTLVSDDKNAHCLEFARNYVIYGYRIYPIQFGSLFAWNNRIISFNSMLFASRRYMNKELYLKYIETYAPMMSTDDWSTLIYYLFKSKIIKDDDDLNFFRQFKETADWVSIEALQKILVITAKVDSHNIFNLDREKSLLDNLRSQMVVRGPKEIILAKDLAESVHILQYVDDEMMIASNIICERLNNCEVASHDYDLTAAPTISRREKRLLADISSKFKELKADFLQN